MVDVCAAFVGDVVGQQLGHHGYRNGCQLINGSGYPDDFVCNGFNPFHPFFSNGDDGSFACSDLHQVAQELGECALIGAESHRRALLADERDRPMLHLPSGISIGIDVGDFLEF